jgi:hypothetical protein
VSICLFVLGISTAQETASSDSGDDGFATRDSSVGYIDNAAPVNQIFIRYDSGYGFRQPNRAEFFYAQGAPTGPGLLRPERSIDFQDLSVYIEKTFAERWSAFVELPTRFLNPDINENAAGFGDMNAGFKFNLVNGPTGVASLQLRTYIPTGEADRGLGNNHVSLEPAFLFFKPITERLGLAGEFRYWIPIGGTDFASDIFRYGFGLKYDLIQDCDFRLSPIVEFVGWTVVDGQETTLLPTGILLTDDSAGRSIFNVKAGVLLGLGERFDFYAGYGRSLTGDRWYEDIARFEIRFRY